MQQQLPVLTIIARFDDVFIRYHDDFLFYDLLLTICSLKALREDDDGIGFLLCTRGKTLTKMEGFDPDVWNSDLDEGKVPKAQ